MEDNDLLKVRLEKIAALKAAGVDLYPNDIKPQNTTSDILVTPIATSSHSLALNFPLPADSWPCAISAKPRS